MRDFLHEICKETAELQLNRFGSAGVIRTKSNATDVVTEVDIASEKLIIERLKARFPGDGFLGEESGLTEGAGGVVWTIDPLDGTLNYSTGVPLFAMMIGRVEDGTVTHGVIHVPSTDEFYYAEAGKGASRNGEPIHCSGKNGWADSYGLGMASFKENKFDLAIRYAEKGKAAPYWMNALGTIAVSCAWVADGRRDWYASSGGKDWDYTPSALIMKEAGCIVTSDRGEPWRYGDKSIVAANAVLHPELLEIVKR